MTWYEVFQFSKARQREASKRMRRLLARTSAEDSLLPLEEVQDRLGLFAQYYKGIDAIPVASIIGSVGRNTDFDDEFLPTSDRIKQRWERLEKAFPYGDFPPIDVYQVGDAYFVIDGHHRVAIARQRGIEFIDADITVLTTNEPLDAGTRIGDVIMAQQRQQFFRDSGLAGARPNADIVVSRPPSYGKLLELVRSHGFNEMQRRGEVLSAEVIAADWYDRVYLPRIDAIQEAGLLEMLPNATPADVFLLVHERRYSMFPSAGDVSFEDAVEATTKDERKKGSAPTRVIRRITPKRRKEDL